MRDARGRHTATLTGQAGVDRVGSAPVPPAPPVHADPRRAPRHLASRGRRRGARGVRRLGRGARHLALRGAGRGDPGARERAARRARYADRVGEVARRHGAALLRPLLRPALVLHVAHQGAREREVLRALRDVRRRPGRHGDRRRVDQRGRADHLLHRGDPRQPRAQARRRRGRRLRHHGRVPLLQRPHPRSGRCRCSPSRTRSSC